jgi:hypothetical protein
MACDNGGIESVRPRNDVRKQQCHRYEIRSVSKIVPTQPGASRLKVKIGPQIR